MTTESTQAASGIAFTTISEAAEYLGVSSNTLRNWEKTWPCQPGTAKDTKHWMAPDFDAPLDDFKESM